MMNAYDFAGRTAVVTGGCNGIGAAIVERLLASGARVAIWDLRPEEIAPRVAGRIGPDLGVIATDVSDPDVIAAAAEATEARFGGIDVLVNSAGIAGPTHALADYPVEAWRRVQAVNLDGTFLACRAVVPGMVRRGYGRIVNIASIAGKEGNPNASAYSASKAAVIALTKSLGKELAGHDIAVNCVTPATAQTRILEQVSAEFVEYMRAKIPRGRFVTVEEIASMVAWLCSTENSFTTGAVFDLSGGRATY
jgi:2-dehydro-3-deoxy-L-rhamnonate dehydrogenase (NAD+)